MAAAKLVTAWDPTEGKAVQIDASEAEHLDELGLEGNTAADQERRAYASKAGLGEAAIAAGEGLASGASLGLYDIAAAGIGGTDYTHQRQLRRGVYGNLETIGQVGGSILPILLSGGTGALARGASLTPSALLARGGLAAEGLVGRGLASLGSGAARGFGREVLERAASMGVGAAIEGGVAGAGNALGEAAINDQLGGPDRVAELAWAGAKSGAMFGLFGGAALGGLSGAAQGASRALGSRLLRGGDALAESADTAAIKALVGGQGLRSSEVKKFGSREALQKAGRDLREYTLADGRSVIEAGDTLESIAPKVAAGRAEVGSALGDIRTRANEVGLPDAERFVKRIHSELINPLLGSPSPTIRSRANDVISELADFEGRVGARRASLEAADSAAQRVDDLLAPMLGSKSARIAEKARELAARTQAIRESIGANSLTHAEFKAFADDVLTPLSRAPSSKTRAAAQALKKELAKSRIENAITLEDMVTQKDILRDVIEPRTPDGQKATGIHIAKASDNELGRARNMLEDSIDEHIQTALPAEADRYRELKSLYGTFKNADKTAQKYMTNNVANRAISLTDYLSGMGAVTAAMTTGSLVPMVGAVALPLANKLLRERGSSTLAALVTRAQRTSGSIDRAIDNFFTQAGKRLNPAVRGATRTMASGAATFDVARALHVQRDETPGDAYDRLAARVQTAAQGGLAAGMVVDDVAPNVGHAMRGVQLRAAQHLAAHLPSPPRTTNNPNLGALTNQSKPDPVQLYEFARRVEAIDKPQSILRDLENGTLSTAAIEAVRDVYPTLYAGMQAQVLDRLGDTEALLHYEDRIRLGILFELPTDPTLRPEYLRLTQQTYAVQNQPTPAPKPSAPGPSARAKSLQTVADQLETGEYPS
jgi:hypothetical protein